MRITFATAGGTAGRANEDWVAATSDAVVVLDGVTAPKVSKVGCRHAVAWFSRQLGESLLGYLADGGPLADSLAAAIGHVSGLHASTCDLGSPGVPAAAVAILRARGSHLDYLVLADTTVAIETYSEIVTVTDRRVDDAAPEALARTRQETIGSAAHRLAVAEMSVAQLSRRNSAGGYWVAATDPAAAEHALTGSIALRLVRRAAVLTDGASRAVDLFGEMSWAQCLDVLEHDGPLGLISGVRRIEEADPEGRSCPRFKKSDDATVAFVKH